MKNKLLILLIFPTLLFSQSSFKIDERAYEIINNSTVECIYSYTVNAPLKADTTKKRTLVYNTILQTNGYDSKFWDWHLFKKDSILFSPREKELTKYEKRKLLYKYYANVEDLFTPIIFKNYKNNKFKVTDYIDFINYSYTEKESNQQLELKEDTLTICGYKCNKAVIKYGGNEWRVWYTMEIPISDGPWKLSGLPGLILKAQDKGNIHTFEIISIRNSNNPIYISLDVNKVKVKRKQYLKHKNYFENKNTDEIISNDFKQGGATTCFFLEYKYRLSLKRDVKYCPLEK